MTPQQKWWKRRKERCRSEGVCAWHRLPLVTRVHCERCREWNRERHKIWRQRVYSEVIKAYGSKCVCCGETNIGFLTIDHVNNDGWKERQETGTRGGYTFYKKIVSEGFPNRYQLLCYNCNLSKSRFGECAHTPVGFSRAVEKLGSIKLG